MKLRNRPLRALMVVAIVAIALVGLLQLTPGCTEWRAWKESKRGAGYHTLELMIPASYCIGSRQP